MACKQGIRQNIENSKKYYEQQRRYDPFRELWKYLVNRVYETEIGYQGLTADERLYFSVKVLKGEVYNGGLHQFFSNSSGELYQDAANGLLELGAHETLRILLKGKVLLFGEIEPPTDRGERWHLMRQYGENNTDLPDWASDLEQVDKAFWQDPDRLGNLLDAFAEKRGLLAPFLKEGESSKPSGQ
jgi:hypothetical protein